MVYENIVDYCSKSKKIKTIKDFESLCGFGNGTVGKWKDGKFQPSLNTLMIMEQKTGIPIGKWVK